jgi:hypothetical protein
MLMPLAYFYASAGKLLPEIHFLEGVAVPEPYRHLLVHASDMTPRLRAFHQQEIGLHVEQCQTSDESVMRLVVLHGQQSRRPVEIGAIMIQDSIFAPADRALIREGITPLGSILEKQRIPHQSAPKAYFRLQTDDFLQKLLGQSGPQTVYGRCNALSDAEGIIFADIVEILPVVAA